MGNTRSLIQLRQDISALGSALVAFSGGVDSTFLLKICQEELGDSLLAVTADSDTYPSRELNEARHIAQSLGVEHEIIQTDEINIEGFKNNPPDRCYYCKRELFSRLLAIAQKRRLSYVLDGSNADDTNDFRPGARAAAELGIRSPLKESGLSKDDIRQFSREMGLPTWNKPAYACLSSRIPYGEEITHEKLQVIAKAEIILHDFGFTGCRVRYHGHVARLEIPAPYLAKAIEPEIRATLVSKLKAIGFTYVTLDLEGYRTGSMNEVL